MKKTGKTKPWRLNVLINYDGQSCANDYRPYLLELLVHLALIYKLDYVISEEHQFSFESNSDEKYTGQDIIDLFYFRSNVNTRIERKDLRETIDCTFRKVPSVIYEGVDVGAQLYKALNQFPFPTEFYRPLDYPCIEYHKDDQTTLLVYSDALQKESETE